MAVDALVVRAADGAVVVRILPQRVVVARALLARVAQRLITL
jgi:hypothetical protein